MKPTKDFATEHVSCPDNSSIHAFDFCFSLISFKGSHRWKAIKVKYKTEKKFEYFFIQTSFNMINAYGCFCPLLSLFPLGPNFSAASISFWLGAFFAINHNLAVAMSGMRAKWRQGSPCAFIQFPLLGRTDGLYIRWQWHRALTLWSLTCALLYTQKHVSAEA